MEGGANWECKIQEVGSSDPHTPPHFWVPTLERAICIKIEMMDVYSDQVGQVLGRPIFWLMNN